MEKCGIELRISWYPIYPFALLRNNFSLLMFTFFSGSLNLINFLIFLPYNNLHSSTKLWFNKRNKIKTVVHALFERFRPFQISIKSPDPPGIFEKSGNPFCLDFALSKSHFLEIKISITLFFKSKFMEKRNRYMALYENERFVYLLRKINYCT